MGFRFDQRALRCGVDERDCQDSEHMRGPHLLSLDQRAPHLLTTRHTGRLLILRCRPFWKVPKSQQYQIKSASAADVKGVP